MTHHRQQEEGEEEEKTGVTTTSRSVTLNKANHRQHQIQLRSWKARGSSTQFPGGTSKEDVYPDSSDLDGTWVPDNLDYETNPRNMNLHEVRGIISLFGTPTSINSTLQNTGYTKPSRRTLQQGESPPRSNQEQKSPCSRPSSSEHRSQSI